MLHGGRWIAAVVAGFALAGAVLASAPEAARADVEWLCRPGVEPNPCRESLETTVHSPAGDSHVENPPLPADPPVDCFYVYPTVSEQPSRNANKDRDAQVVAIARYQAARFSQVCRVYAPVYRQQTLAGLALGGSAEAIRLAYDDVAEAFREYLGRDNRGRGFVLLGHSQGTRMLRQLLRDEIDPRPELRRRLVSGMLLGGNVLVRAGQTAGGDFKAVPACTGEAQTGCVMAWSTFNETPPRDSRYGRPPAENTSGSGFPAGPEYEVLCTNPASLAANERRPLSSYLRSEPFPGVIGLLLVEMFGGPPPTAPTPWIQPQDHYTGRCEERDGARVLMLEPIGNARRLNPAPEPTWGLHLADGNIALGDLVDVTGLKARAYLSSQRTPRLALRLGHRTGRDARGRRCASPPIAAALRGADAGKVARVRFTLGGKTLADTRAAPFRIRIGASRLRAGALARIGAEAVLADGRTRRLARAVRVCSA
jgi:hypothetical protein